MKTVIDPKILSALITALTGAIMTAVSNAATDQPTSDITKMTCSSPRCPLCSHSQVCIENHLFIVGIGPILNKELELIFRSDRSDRTYVYS